MTVANVPPPPSPPSTLNPSIDRPHSLCLYNCLVVSLSSHRSTQYRTIFYTASQQPSVFPLTHLTPRGDEEKGLTQQKEATRTLLAQAGCKREEEKGRTSDSV